jgi:hypothetical protein
MRDRRDAQPDAGPWSEGRLEYVSPAKSFGRESTMLQGVARNQTAPVRWRSVEGGARYEATLAEPEQWLPRRQRFKVALCTPFSSSPAPPVASFFLWHSPCNRHTIIKAVGVLRLREGPQGGLAHPARAHLVVRLYEGGGRGIKLHSLLVYTISLYGQEMTQQTDSTALG